MNDIIRQLFEAAEANGDFEEADAMLVRECEKRLRPYREHLQDIGYEQIRDVVYSVSYFSKRSAFETGFKTAARLMMECLRQDSVT